jgi:hypothetical protein
MVLSKKIEVRVSAISGRGLYAKERITKGETVSLYFEESRSRKSLCVRAKLTLIPMMRAIDVTAHIVSAGLWIPRFGSLDTKRDYSTPWPPFHSRVFATCNNHFQLWEAEPDESKWFYTMEQIKAWPEEEQKHFMNNAYLVKPGTYSGGSDTLRREQAVPRA